MSNIRLERLIKSGKVALREGQCLDCYNQQVHQDVHIAITARYDDGNKWVTIIEDV